MKNKIILIAVFFCSIANLNAVLPGNPSKTKATKSKKAKNNLQGFDHLLQNPIKK
ncbi:hypothetical protein [Aurantibacillus circumpalustris]|uniref:hypothetical protein n=1 Tax=Aurantibacillus circumpalustris TaxID=3036359 RepID=UPI00295C1EA7|nr:hypothetical protein [Aurantibacillus circumpalustris]